MKLYITGLLSGLDYKIEMLRIKNFTTKSNHNALIIFPRK